MDINTTLALNGSHDCSFTFIDKKNKLRIYEYERFTKKRYCAFTKTQDHVLYGSNDIDRELFINFLKNKLINPDIKTILYHDLFDIDFKFLKEHFPNCEFIYCNHHESHAYGALHNSGFNKCLIFSVDGGGHDNGQISMTNVFLYNNNELSLLEKSHLDFGSPYRFSSFFIKDIPSPGDGDLSESGKFMGLAAYGNIRTDWINAFVSFYSHHQLHVLAHELQIPFERKSLEGQIAYDFAATSQHVFEQLLFNFINLYIEKYKTDVVITGGCGLNVLFNQKLYKYLKDKNLKIYVPPNPSDCGLSHGMWVSKFKDTTKDEICFSGFEILDENDIDLYDKTHKSEKLDLKNLVEYLKQGKIIGIIDSTSEVGPRALGNRSIICNPAFKNMKDVLNSKVKFREWFRPFAPVCRLEDKDTYFIDAPECTYMSYAPLVKEHYREKLPSITHIDGSSRLQTVKKDCLFYNILNEMEKQNEIPVILNTSFNIKGKPILTSLKDAFYVLDNTELDLLIYKDKIYSKL